MPWLNCKHGHFKIRQDMTITERKVQTFFWKISVKQFQTAARKMTPVAKTCKPVESCLTQDITKENQCTSLIVYSSYKFFDTKHVESKKKSETLLNLLFVYYCLFTIQSTQHRCLLVSSKWFVYCHHCYFKNKHTPVSRY